MTRLLTTLTAISMAMLSIGCVRTSHELREVGETVADDEIVGVWEEQDLLFKKSRVIQKHKNGCYLERGLDRRCEVATVFRLVKVGDVTYIECDPDETSLLSGEKPSKQAIPGSPNQFINFFPWRYERRGEWVAIWEPDQAVVNRLISEGALTGRTADGWLSSTDVTSTAEELAACLEEHSDEIYAISDPQHSQRHVFRCVFAQVPATTLETTSKP